MSTIRLHASTSSSVSDTPTERSIDISQHISSPSQNMSRDPEVTPTQIPTVSQTAQVDPNANNTVLAAGESTDINRNTLSPPASRHSSTHAQASHLQPAAQITTHIASDSPLLSMTSSGPSLTHLSAPIPTFPRHQPSSPLPSIPPAQRHAQPAASRSSTGSNVPGRSLSFLDPPSRRGSGSTRGNNGNGHRQGYSSPNGSRNDRRTMSSSLATSMEKGALSMDSDTSRVFAIDFGYGDRPRDSRYHDSAIMMPNQALTEDEKERDSDATGRSRVLLGPEGGGGGGGDGNGGPGGLRIDRDSDSICMPRFPRTVQERLQPTIDHAMAEEVKYAQKAKITGLALNIAIGLQVFLSALITGLSAVTTGRQTQIVTAILGGLGTVVASYLARARGSNEPELSIARTKDLQRFIRTCDAFVQDHGQETGFEDSEGKEGVQDLRRARELDERIRELRNDLEHLLGNGDGERRLSPLV